MLPPYLIHIGYGKTATTWLQTYYFPRRDAGLAFVRERKATIADGIEGKSPGRYIIEAPLFHYDPGSVRQKIDALFAADRAAGLTPVISNEQLSGSPPSGGWLSKEHAWRLSSAFPDAKIFIVVREQRAMIRSCYMQYLRAGGIMSLPRYLGGPTDGQLPQPDLHYFRYDRLVQHYIELFSRERVLCLPYELLRDQPDCFLPKLDAFASATPAADLPLAKRENARDGMLQYLVWPWLNPLVHRRSLNGHSRYALDFLHGPARSVLKRASRMTPKRLDNTLLRRWERRIEAATANFYEESNRRLGELIGIDLGAYGWKVARPAATAVPAA